MTYGWIARLLGEDLGNKEAVIGLVLWIKALWYYR